jgi:hypothetical protein
MGGPGAVLALPVVIECILIMVGVELSVRTRSSVPFDGIILVTLVELLRGAIVPVFLQFFGQDDPIYRQLGSYDDGVLVLLIANLFYFTFLLASAAWSVRHLPNTIRSTVERVHQSHVSAGAWLLIVVGSVGLVLRFPTVLSIATFLAGDYEALQTSSAGGAEGFVASILRPLLPLGIALLIADRKRKERNLVIPTLFLLASMFFALGSYGLNRSTIIFPVIAFAAAYAGVIGFHLRLRASITLGFALVIGFFAIGSLRGSLYADRLGQTGEAKGTVAELVQTVLIYGQSPLQSAPTLAARINNSPWGLTSLLQSLLSPIPGVSDALRAGSGTTIYNKLLYQNSVSKDQILPSWLEAFLSVGVAGPIMLGVAAASALWWLDRRRARASNLLGSYGPALAVVWLAQLSVNSVSGVGQGLIYFAAAPIALGLAAKDSLLSEGSRGKKIDHVRSKAN